ncbi:MAG: hypothetical protein ACJARX_000368 [Psychroserpens sp.]|jgi:hypothetical protein|uniref:hypothetical protein n=1 Tax=Colwellia sp. KU-HH00111 TaxID=3127652 RepID=UPI003107C3A8
MEKSTLLYKQIRVAKFNVNQALALVKHDILLQSDEQLKQNRITSKSHLNIYKFKDKIISSKSDREKALLYVESLFMNDNANFENIKFSKVKSKFKKWIKATKTTSAEVKLFKKLLKIADEFSDRKVNSKSLINKFSSISEQVTRFNDKKRALETFADLHNQKIGLNIDSSSQLNTRIISLLFKIPEHNAIKLDAEIQEEILLSYYKENFSNYEVILSSIHKDEATRDHVHVIIDGMNKQTKKCDFVQKQYEYIKNKCGLLDFPDNYSKCRNRQVQEIGKLLQEDFYYFANEKSINHNIMFVKKEYESILHKDIEREVIKNDAGKRIADREYNTANYLAKQKDKNYLENTSLKKENKKLKEENLNLLSIIENLVKSTIDYAAEYAATALQRALLNFGDGYKKLLNINEFIADNARDEAINLQQTDQQKKEIEQVANHVKNGLK